MTLLTIIFSIAVVVGLLHYNITSEFKDSTNANEHLNKQNLQLQKEAQISYQTIKRLERENAKLRSELKYYKTTPTQKLHNDSLDAFEDDIEDMFVEPQTQTMEEIAGELEKSIKRKENALGKTSKIELGYGSGGRRFTQHEKDWYGVGRPEVKPKPYNQDFTVSTFNDNREGFGTKSSPSESRCDSFDTGSSSSSDSSSSCD